MNSAKQEPLEGVSGAFGEFEAVDGFVVGVGGRRCLLLFAFSSRVLSLEPVASLSLASSVAVASVCWDGGSVGMSRPGVGSLGAGL